MNGRLGENRGGIMQWIWRIVVIVGRRIVGVSRMIVIVGIVIIILILIGFVCRVNELMLLSRGRVWVLGEMILEVGVYCIQMPR